MNVKYSGNGYHASPEDAKGIAKQMIASGYKEWDNDNDWQALVWIWQQRVRLAVERHEPHVGRVRHPAVLSRVEARGRRKRLEGQRGDPDQMGLQYIKQRYGSPHQAKEFWLRNNAY